jgi:sorbitol-6-phosphate 2-dehydrogenase
MLSNRLALVTGGASGIGLEVCLNFAKEGATVIAVDLSENVFNTLPKLESPRDHTLKHSAYTCDVSKSDSVKELFQKIKHDYPKHKGPSIVVNCVIIIYFLSLLI